MTLRNTSQKILIVLGYVWSCSEIGSEGKQGTGSDRFDLTLCTPDRFLEELKVNEYVLGHGILIVPKYSYEKIKSHIESYINGCKGNNVEDVMRRVGLLGEWEYEWEIKRDKVR